MFISNHTLHLMFLSAKLNLMYTEIFNLQSCQPSRTDDFDCFQNDSDLMEDLKVKTIWQYLDEIVGSLLEGHT